MVDMTRIIDTIFGIGWIVFWLYWIYVAIKTKGLVHRISRNGVKFRLISIILILIVISYGPNNWSTAHNSKIMQIIGLVLFASGLMFAIWARIYLGKNWGFPSDQVAGSKLITSGPYQFVRHPIYSGIILAMIGTTVALTLNWLIVTVVIGGYFVKSAFDEEKYMKSKFANQYPKYMSESKMLIPFIF